VGGATGGSAIAQDSHPGWWLISGCAVVIVALSIGSTGAWARGTAERAASAFRAEAAPAD
jgi:hypothetical protein